MAVTLQDLEFENGHLVKVRGMRPEYVSGGQLIDMVRDLAALLAAPAPSGNRNDDAGFVEFVNEDVPYIVREINGPCAILTDMETRKLIGYRVYDPGCSERDVFGCPGLAAENVLPRTFKLGDFVRKKSGSWWEGRVVGFYSTEQTPDGVCVQLDKPNGPVQIYPAQALEIVPASVDEIAVERNAIAAEARRYAGHYPEASDGRNTFVIFAEWVEARGAKEKR